MPLFNVTNLLLGPAVELFCAKIFQDIDFIYILVSCRGAYGYNRNVALET